MFGLSLLFFMSGFAALVYELIWFRQLGHIFGNTVYAATATLSAYMLGLALGSYLFGRIADRIKKPIRMFGVIEIAIGICGILTPVLFRLIRLIHVWLFQNVSESTSFLTGIRFILAIIVLLAPTMLMGGSLPILATGLLKKTDDFGRRLGILYGINTLGAVFGVLLTGFLFIPALGIWQTTALAVLFNVAVGVVAWSPRLQIVPTAINESHQKRPTHLNKRIYLLLLAVGASGFLSLAFEVIWFRALILIFGSTTYSFSVMLGVFLLGIALGSFLLSKFADHLDKALLIFGITEAGICIYTLCSLYWFDAMPTVLLSYLADSGFSWTGLVAGKFTITLFFLLVPTLLFGVDIPIAARAVRELLPSASHTVGVIYASNTIGSVIGSIVAGFIMLPIIGIVNSLIVLALLSGVLGTYLAILATNHNRRLRLAVMLVPLVCGILVIFEPPIWSPKLMTLGAYFQPMRFIQGNKLKIDSKLDDMRLDYFKQGKTATIAVVRSDCERLKYVNTGKIEADSSIRSMTLQRMQGHLPMLFHPNPLRVLNIGLGAGVTFGSLGCYSLNQLEVVEIEPTAQGVAQCFSNYNHNIIQHPNAEIIINDGRNYLACTTSQYDVITSDPFEPVYAGANNLYTVEHFKTARSKLREGGIMGQYLPLYELSSEDYMSIVRSFITVFPETLLFYTGDDTILLGYNGEPDLNFGYLQAKFRTPTVSNSLAYLGFESPEQIAGMFVADMRMFPDIKNGRLNTDDHPYVEFSAPKIALQVTTDSNQRELLSFFSTVPENLLRGLSPVQIKLVEDNRAALKMALKANVMRSQGQVNKSISLLEKALQRAKEHSVIKNRLADALMMRAQQIYMPANQMQQAVSDFRHVLKLRPSEFWALFFVSNSELQARNFTKADALITRAEKMYPDSAIIMALRGYYEFKLKHYAKAIEWMDQAVATRPDKASIWHQYALMAKRMNDPSKEKYALAQEARILQHGVHDIDLR